MCLLHLQTLNENESITVMEHHLMDLCRELLKLRGTLSLGIGLVSKSAVDPPDTPLINEILSRWMLWLYAMH
ncbi:hypothetical protein LINPERPRIM_LOCUS27650 [Linum perenne]